VALSNTLRGGVTQGATGTRDEYVVAGLREKDGVTTTGGGGGASGKGGGSHELDCRWPQGWWLERTRSRSRSSRRDKVNQTTLYRIKVSMRYTMLFFFVNDACLMYMFREHEFGRVLWSIQIHVRRCICREYVTNTTNYMEHD
jgi:hypothetical protein